MSLVRLLAVSILLLVSTRAVVKADDGRGTLGGIVIDNFGHPLEGVAVSIADVDLQTATDRSGHYSLQYVPGSITVFYEKGGYAKWSTKCPSGRFASHLNRLRELA